MWRWPLLAATVVVEGRGGQRCRLARDLAELGHADDEGEGGPLADAGDRADEVEAARQVGARFELGGKLLLLGFEEIAEGNDIACGISRFDSKSRVCSRRRPLEADDVLLDLLDVGEVEASFARRLSRGFAGFQPGGALGDEAGVEAIVLGPLEGAWRAKALTCMGWRWRTVRPWSPEMGEDALLVAAGGFTVAARRTLLALRKPGDLAPAFGRVVGFEGFVGGIEGDIEGMFACIDVAVVVDWRIFVVPALLANLKVRAAMQAR
ncbi:MAG: hypothetical protein U1E49_09260 [Hyphomicrobiaceae bacterium]